MTNRSYQEWVALYDSDIEKIWYEERHELRKIAIIYHVLQKEFFNIKKSVEEEIRTLQSDLERKDSLKNTRKRLMTDDMKQIYEENKENLIIPETEDFNETNMMETTVVSLEDDFSDHSESTVLNEVQLVTQNSPIINKKTSAFKKLRTEPLARPASKITKLSLKQYANSPKICDFTSSVIDSSIIDKLPKVKSKKNSRIKSDSSFSARKHKKSEQSSTLTQMFAKPKCPTKFKKGKIPSQSADSMYIDDIMDYINRTESSPETFPNSDHENENDVTLDDLDLDVRKPDQVSEHPQLNVRKYITNDFMDVLDKIPNNQIDEPDYAYQEVVRGKERKKLKGWSCQECKRFYEGMNLSPRELEKKMDECSKHRGKFQLQDETFDGFWDVTIGPTPAKRDSRKSTCFNLRK